jgi:hypothetical protein
MAMSIEELSALCTENGRICPQPQRWNELYKLLPNTNQVGAGWAPPLPLIQGGWWHSSDSEKQQRLAVHIRWAAEHGALDAVAAYLASLKEDDWYHTAE